MGGDILKALVLKKQDLGGGVEDRIGIGIGKVGMNDCRLAAKLIWRVGNGKGGRVWSVSGLRAGSLAVLVHWSLLLRLGKSPPLRGSQAESRN